MPHDDIVIAGYAETPIVLRSGRSAYDLAGEAYSALLESTGLAPADIDGASISASISEAGNNFFASYLCEALGLATTWLNASNLGGASMVAGVGRAASAIRDGQCTTALVLAADAPSTRSRQIYGAYRPEFKDPAGAAPPPVVFGLLAQHYAHRHGLDPHALGRIAMVQRHHARLNPNACPKLTAPLGMEDYLASRMISSPLRLLDCAMYCDGANAVLVTSAGRARELGLDKTATLTAYAEISNSWEPDACPDLLENGFHRIAPRLYARSGLAPGRLHMAQLYDDFTVAVLLQLEALGFCAAGSGPAFVLDTDLGFDGALPLNTGGGQLSCGQPGLAGGGVMLAEAVRQLFGEGGARQIPEARNALVTGLGVLPYSPGWGTSAGLILQT